MKKVIILCVVVVGLAFLGLVGRQVYVKVKGGGKDPAAKARRSERGGPRGGAVAVEVAPVEHGAIPDIGVFTGSLQARSYYVVAPKIAGRLAKLTVDIGDHVNKGQVVATLDDEEYAQEVEQARAQLEVAKANAAEAQSAMKIQEREFERTKTLLEKHIASDSDFDSAQALVQAQQARYKVAVAQQAQQEAALTASNVRLGYTQMKATSDGQVGERFVDQGAMLRANDPVVSIIDLSTVTAAVFVIERDYRKVQVGQRATITTDGAPGKVFIGRVSAIAPLLSETSRQALVQITVPNPEVQVDPDKSSMRLLKAGMFVRVQIEFARHDNATIAPLAALVRRDNKPGVFIIDEVAKKAKFVPVEVGVINGNRMEILKPEVEGVVAVLGHDLLTDGTDVVLPGQNIAPQPGAGAKAAPDANAGKQRGGKK